MAADFVELALEGIGPAVDNYDYVKERVKKVHVPAPLLRRIRRDQQGRSYEEYTSYRTSNADQRDDRNQRGSYEVKYVQAQTRSPPQYSGGPRTYDAEYDSKGPDGYGSSSRPRARSVGQADYTGGVGGRGPRRDPGSQVDRRPVYSSDSESSVPPRDRDRRKSVGEQALARQDGGNPRGDAVATRGSNDGAYKSRDAYDDGHESDGSSSSDVSVSSSEDERRARKLRYTVPLSAGLAAVASIHAANGIRKSLEDRDKRVEQRLRGEISKEQSKKLEKRGYIQDAATVALAALAIKGVHSSWQDVTEHTKEYKEAKKAKQLRHEKRLQKLEKSRSGGYEGSGGRYASSEQDLSRGYRDERPRDRDRYADRH